MRAAEADYNSLEARLESDRLTQRARGRRRRSRLRGRARRRTKWTTTWPRMASSSALQRKNSTVRCRIAGEARTRSSRRASQVAETQHQGAAAGAAGAHRSAALAVHPPQQQVDQLRVRAGMSGVLEQVTVNVGQQVAPGTNLARVADPTRLKAELRIAETQAKRPDHRPARAGRHAQRHHRGQGHPHRPGGAAGHRHGRRGADRRAAARRASRPERRRHDRARTARQRAVRRPPGLRPGAEHGRPVQGRSGDGRSESARRCSSGAARSTPSRCSAGSAKAIRWSSPTCRRGISSNGFVCGKG